MQFAKPVDSVLSNGNKRKEGSFVVPLSVDSSTLHVNKDNRRLVLCKQQLSCWQDCHSVLFRDMEERNCDSNRQIVNIAINFNTKSAGIVSEGDRDHDREEFSSTSLNPQTVN